MLGPGSCQDQLVITQKNRSKPVWSGSRDVPLVISSTNQLRVEFKSCYHFTEVSASGFDATFETAGEAENNVM